MQPQAIVTADLGGVAGNLVRLRPLPPQTAVEPGEMFGQALHRWRTSRRLSLRALAQQAHYSSSYLHDLERGKKPGNVDLARQLDEALQTGGELERLAPGPAEQAPMKPPPRIRPATGRDGWMVLQIGDAVLVLEPSEVAALREQLAES